MVTSGQMPNLARLTGDFVAKSRERVATRAKKSWKWLIDPPDLITWADLRRKLASRFAVLGGIVLGLGGIVLLLLLVLPWYAAEKEGEKGAVTYPHASLINPILGGLGALFLIYIAIRQARTATAVAQTGNLQAEIASRHHVTETFSKAIEQLGSDKLEVRLGGIYALERISQESPRVYWTVMENLTAFVRERTRRTEAERAARPLDQHLAERAYLLWETAGRPEGRSEEFWAQAVEEEKLGEPPATDIAAVLTVIKRRSEHHRGLEARDSRVLDFRNAVLRRADLSGAHLERADLSGAHLERAYLIGAHLEYAYLFGAHLEGADLRRAHLERADLRWAHLERAHLGGAHLEYAYLFGAHLEGAYLIGAHLEGADLRWAHLEGADLNGVHLEGANLSEAHLEGARLRRAEGLTQAQIDSAFGDAETELPEGLTRPAHWTDPTAPRPFPDLS